MWLLGKTLLYMVLCNTCLAVVVHFSQQTPDTSLEVQKVAQVFESI